MKWRLTLPSSFSEKQKQISNRHDRDVCMCFKCWFVIKLLYFFLLYCISLCFKRFKWNKMNSGLNWDNLINCMESRAWTCVNFYSWGWSINWTIAHPPPPPRQNKTLANWHQCTKTNFLLTHQIHTTRGVDPFFRIGGGGGGGAKVRKIPNFLARFARKFAI